jgi:hypothetical protein
MENEIERDRGIDDVDDEDIEDVCAGCGMEKIEWKGNNGKGYLKNGQAYCGRDCSEGIECKCGL